MVNPKVMLIEDDASMRSLLTTLLEIEGYQVAKGSDQASETEQVEVIRREKPDAVLMDVHLRTGSGIEILRQLRADTELKNVRVIMTSGMDVQDECMDVGANGFLMKPYMPDELIRKLKG